MMWTLKAEKLVWRTNLHHHCPHMVLAAYICSCQARCRPHSIAWPDQSPHLTGLARVVPYLPPTTNIDGTTLTSSTNPHPPTEPHLHHHPLTLPTATTARLLEGPNNGQ